MVCCGFIRTLFKLHSSQESLLWTLVYFLSEFKKNESNPLMLKEKLTELRTLQKLIYKDEKKVADAAVSSYDVYSLSSAPR